MPPLACVLTPPGRGALAVVHVAGEGATELVARMFGRAIDDRPRYGRLAHGGETLDEVMVRRAPGFTGEETVEISCHGGRAPVEAILVALVEAGSRRVGTKELLDRGVETGFLDRLRAEAWVLLPGALTELAARVLNDQAEGALSRAVGRMRSRRDAEKLLATAPRGLALASPRRVALAGAPNVGKSTLFNALVRSDRVLVSDLPGTTRDPVREPVAIRQVPFVLVDTAGIEAARDALEGLSIDRALRAIGEADVVILLFDASREAGGEERGLWKALEGRRMIVAANKIDAGRRVPPGGAIRISARTGRGLDRLRARIVEELGGRPRYRSGEAVVFTERQRRALEEVAEGKVSVEAGAAYLLERKQSRQ